MIADLPAELLIAPPDDFAGWQPRFAEMGIPIFPVGKDKRPAVKGYLDARLPQAKGFASGRFGSFQSFGMACGPISGVTVLDIDSTDANHVADAMGRHGETPLVVQTQSGGHHLYYRHDGERRAVRPWGEGLPLDQLGAGGFVVAPPSKGDKGTYRIVAGSMEDLAALPVMRDAWHPPAVSTSIVVDSDLVGKGQRNTALFRAVMRDAHHCDDLADVLDVAETLNDGMFAEPLPDAEVKRLAASVWKITSEGNNRIGQHGAWFTQRQIAALAPLPHLMALIGWLMGQNRPDSAGFFVADAMREKFLPGWSREKFADTRAIAVTTGWLKRIRAPRPGVAALYVWGPARFA